MGGCSRPPQARERGRVATKRGVASGQEIARQIRVGGRNVWEFATNAATRAQMEFLFAEVEHLPTPFNQADTAAEANGEPGGLCSALALACTKLITTSLPAKPGDGKIPLELLQPAYEDWFQLALLGLNNAIHAKQDKEGIPPLQGNPYDGYTLESISARSTASAKQWNRDEALSVLRYYREDQQQRTWQWVVGSCQERLREVEATFTA